MICYVCNNNPISKNEIGLSKKLMDTAGKFYCMTCLAEALEVDQEFLADRIKEYKQDGCALFN